MTQYTEEKHCKKHNGSDEPQLDDEDLGDVAFDMLSWLRPNDLKRIKGDPHWPTLLPILDIGIIRSIARSFVTSSTWYDLQRNTTDQYFPNEFLEGANMAFLAFFQQFNKNNTYMLRKYLSPALYKIFSPELEELGEMGLAVKMEPQKIHASAVLDIWADYGPSRAFDLSIPFEERQQDYFYSPTFCLRAAHPRDTIVTKASSPWGKRDAIAELDNKPSSIVKALKAGFNIVQTGARFKVDVRYDVSMKYSAFKANDLILSEEGRQAIVFRFETPHYSPSSELSLAYLKREDEAMPGLRPDHVVPEEDIDPPFEWKISDVDYLIHQRERRELETM
ncbi:hypothetical protein H4219_000825 [Mycoemilia scoparia]|uniref:Uncharacterized protein n=1 Tax=Mycoemilia scoparia TaxID=417184 RepID=A0A9W8DWK2_9FUNG|nr:hypothetical protein H4219_000825 [Mycoemilia scoparia]